MGRFVFKLPDVGEGIAEAEVVSWHVAVGSAVAEDDPLVDVMTDKATVEIPSPRAGRVLAITGGPGDKVRVGAELLVLDVDNDEVASPPDEAASPGADVAPLAAPTIPTPAASAGPLLTVAKARRTPQTSGREKIEAAVVRGCREPAIGEGNLIGAGVEEAGRHPLALRDQFGCGLGEQRQEIIAA